MIGRLIDGLIRLRTDGESEDGVGEAASEAIKNVAIGDPRRNGEETEGERRRDPEDGEAELGASRKSEKPVRGESNLAGAGADQRSHRQFPPQQSRTSPRPRRRRPPPRRGAGRRRRVKLR